MKIKEILEKLNISEEEFQTDAATHAIVYSLLQKDEPYEIIKQLLVTNKDLSEQLKSLLLITPSVQSHVSSIISRLNNGTIKTTNGSDEMLLKQLIYIKENTK